MTSEVLTELGAGLSEIRDGLAGQNTAEKTVQEDSAKLRSDIDNFGG